MKNKNIRHIVLFFVCICVTNVTYARENFFCEIGPIGGISYYTGDAAVNVLNPISPSYGGIFRYKFNPRWVIAAKAQSTHSNFMFDDKVQTNKLTEGDLTVEFNFFHLERNSYHMQAKTYSPYLFLGVGAGFYPQGSSHEAGAAMYLPLGFGIKWNFAPRFNFNIEWQRQLFFKDNLEGIAGLNNTNNLNGANFFNNDLISTLTIGLTVNFGSEKKICRSCQR